MSRRDRFYIIIKYHYNPTSNVEAKQKALPVLVLDSDGDPLEYDWEGFPSQRTDCLTQVLSAENTEQIYYILIVLTCQPCINRKKCFFQNLNLILYLWY